MPAIFQGLQFIKITGLRYIIFTSLVGVNSLSLLMFDRQLAGCLGQPKDFRSTCTFNLSKDSSMYAHLSIKTICKGKDNIILLPFCDMFYYYHFVICFIFIYNKYIEKKKVRERVFTGFQSNTTRCSDRYSNGISCKCCSI